MAHGGGKGKARRAGPGGPRAAKIAGWRLAVSSLCEGVSDADEIVADHAEPDPAPHAVVALVAAASEPVAPLDHADAALRSGAPLLPVAEPALLLLAFAVGAFGGAIGNAHALDAFGLRGSLVLAGVKGRIRRHQVRQAPKPRLMRVDRRDQQVGVVGTPVVDLVVDDNLVLGLLQLDHLAKLVGLGRLAFADDRSLRSLNLDT